MNATRPLVFLMVAVMAMALFAAAPAAAQDDSACDGASVSGDYNTLTQSNIATVSQTAMAWAGSNVGTGAAVTGGNNVATASNQAAISQSNEVCET